jgi:hypothetical protein
MRFAMTDAGKSLTGFHAHVFLGEDTGRASAEPGR